MEKFLKLAGAIAICESAGLIGSIFTVNSVPGWYASLEKPVFAPPNFIFAPVWITLYFLMGVSLFLIWEKKKIDLRWFWSQLILNTSWSIVFFGLKNPLLAFIIIIILPLAIFMTIRSFVGIDGKAAYLLYPYFLWVFFAAILNLGIVVLN